jgi:hypothetical protein
LFGYLVAAPPPQQQFCVTQPRFSVIWPWLEYLTPDKKQVHARATRPPRDPTAVPTQVACGFFISAVKVSVLDGSMSFPVAPPAHGAAHLGRQMPESLTWQMIRSSKMRGHRCRGLWGGGLFY